MAEECDPDGLVEEIHSLAEDPSKEQKYPPGSEGETAYVEALDDAAEVVKKRLSE